MSVPLGLIVVLSVVILVEGAVTVSRMVSRSSVAADPCYPDLAQRTNEWCKLMRTAVRDGVLPSPAQFTAAIGVPTAAWTLGADVSARAVDPDGFTLFAACRGAGRLTVTVSRSRAPVRELTIDCDGYPQPSVFVPPAAGPSRYVIGVAVTGDVTEAEYFVR
jgi:hypothetical protein